MVSETLARNLVLYLNNQIGNSLRLISSLSHVTYTLSKSKSTPICLVLCFLIGL